MFGIDPENIITLIIMYPQSTKLRMHNAAVNVSGFSLDVLLFSICSFILIRNYIYLAISIT